MVLRLTVLALLSVCSPLLGEPLPQGDDTILETESEEPINPDAPNTPGGAEEPAPVPPAIPEPAPAPTETTETTVPVEPTEPTPAEIPTSETSAPTETPATDREPTPEEMAAQDAVRLHATEGQNGSMVLPEGDDHVVSQSGLFSVSGADSLRLGAIATHADDIYHHLLNLLDLPDNHRYGISIRLLGSSTDSPRLYPIRTRIRIIDNQPNFQIRIYPGGGIDIARLDNAIITMVLYERALRELEAGAYPDTVALPDWLVTGLVQALQWRSRQIDRNLYRRLFERAEMLPPETIIATEHPEQLDAASRQVYEASCGVLMMSLLSREGGRDQLKTLLAEAATADGTPQEILGAHFHELGLDKNLLNKWWALQLADMALPSAQEALTPLESERQLSEALTLIWYDPETETPRPLRLDNVYELLEHENWRDIIQPCIERLVRLSAICFPDYRPIVAEYCRVIAELTRDADPDAAQNSLGPLQELRHAYLTASIRGRDYLDWYEITHLGRENSRSFDTYLEAMQMLRREAPGPDTAIGRYLDDIESLYKQGADAPLPDSLLLHLPARRPNKPEARRMKSE